MNKSISLPLLLMLTSIAGAVKLRAAPASRTRPGSLVERLAQANAPKTALPLARAATPQNLDSLLAWDSNLKATTITNGTPEANFTFNLTNVSTSDVVITNVQTSCGCTVAKLPALPWTLAPGDSGQIHVSVQVAGVGTFVKTVTVFSDHGIKLLYVKPTVLPMPPAQMDAAERAKNQKIALVDRQSVFQGDCARCHAQPAQNKLGRLLYESACGICHDAAHRASVVPDLHGLPQAANAAFWQNWISYGKPGTLMPAFAQSEGGILSNLQITSLINYCTATFHSSTSPGSPNSAPTTN